MPLPTSIYSVLAAGVDSMAPPTYHFAYGPVDVADPAAWPVGAPQVFLEETGWSPSSAARQVVNKITNTQLVTFRAVVPKGDGADIEMNKVDSDVKRLMVALWPLLSAAGLMLKPEYQETKKNYRLVEAYPGEIRIRYAFTWRQSRENPEST